MRAARVALNDLVDVLALAVEPRQVGVDDGSTPVKDDAVRVRALSLDRVGRSLRDGPVLDLVMVASVQCGGSGALDATELMLEALERRPQMAVEPLPRDLMAAGLVGFLANVPVAVPLPEESGPIVREPLEAILRSVRAQSGRLLDRHGRVVEGAVVRGLDIGSTATTDRQGRFRLLVGATTDEHELEVHVRDKRYAVRAADLDPVVLDRDEEGS